ncbi:FMN-dependent NADH-azoreductase [Phaeobacter sp. 22II1-1F12B]|uniref:FMN-dependent NADH-azoreductase n=1 Tax=Phaeobacter sp. 22II1-1F12B TaxID=1317111 RepID=UPI000B51F762|nr:NAD(P)H-dependent oxidoreductase [Phaeobacter sp. 22II1-1F12B]OWU81080.1 FMN-dependent NADH-azoreductase [Phaeobacter sp. 22II1-1F12B]
MTTSILRIESSASGDGSVTRKLNDKVIAKLAPETVVTRDLVADPLPLIDPTWVAARVVPADERDDRAKASLTLSDELIAEVQAADTLVIAVPIYNFSVPASLKAWIDLIARVGVTFRYTETGPEGLLTGKKAILTVASGGTAVGSPIDHATDYLKFILGFVGITDVTIVAADQLAIDADASLAKADSEIGALAA